MMYIIIIIGSRALYFITVLQNRLAKTPKASLKKRSIMEYSPGLPHDNKSLRNCSGNRVKMILKCILESNVTPNISRSSDSFSTVPPIVNGLECNLSYRRFFAVLCMLNKIKRNHINLLYGALFVPLVQVRVTRDVLVAHQYS